MSQPLPTEAVLDGLEEWLADAGFPGCEIQPLPGDVSPRRYARIVPIAPIAPIASTAGNSTAILASYPPEIRATCQRFLRTSAILEQAGVPAPRILAAACDEGWMLVEDLGPQTLGDWGRGRPWSELGPWFERALDLVDRIARIPASSVADLNPTLGRELMMKELAQTWDLFLEPRGLTGGPALARELRAVLEEICSNLDAETPVSCHRDFMVRNLMALPGGDLAVLDHQDLRLGPPAYDLASLLNDTLFPPPEAEEALLAAEEDRVRYHRAAAQRTLKAVGTYTAFARRGADRHLPLVAPTLGRCLGHLARVPESARLVEDLTRTWAPVLERC
jgi:aminoglycoside/choline kinase family phosphotransferase